MFKGHKIFHPFYITTNAVYNQQTCKDDYDHYDTSSNSLHTGTSDSNEFYSFPH
jgi:hypothetical protein